LQLELKRIVFFPLSVVEGPHLFLPFTVFFQALGSHNGAPPISARELHTSGASPNSFLRKRNKSPVWLPGGPKFYDSRAVSSAQVGNDPCRVGPAPGLVAPDFLWRIPWRASAHPKWPPGNAVFNRDNEVSPGWRVPRRFSALADDKRCPFPSPERTNGIAKSESTEGAMNCTVFACTSIKQGPMKGRGISTRPKQERQPGFRPENHCAVEVFCPRNYQLLRLF